MIRSQLFELKTKFPKIKNYFQKIKIEIESGTEIENDNCSSCDPNFQKIKN